MFLKMKNKILLLKNFFRMFITNLHNTQGDAFLTHPQTCFATTFYFSFNYLIFRTVRTIFPKN